uniref:Peptidase M12B domain-containing protein n=1 Tax=Strigamia maritima TaxID=126957 RepID=T1J947_STRMM
YNVAVSKSSKSKTSSGKRDLQLDVATIEVLVFLDKIVHGKLVAKNTDIKKYLGIFWNTVQNKYKVFNNPKVEFSLSGAIVLSDMSWMVDTFLAPNKPDDEEYLESFANWLFKQDQKGTKINFPKYDVGVLHTGLDLSYKDGNRINPGTLGIAPLKGICADDAEHEVILSSCVFEDPYAPTFAGAMTAAHELGHLLSANHDDPSKCDKHGLMAPEDEQISPSTMVFCNSSIEQIKNELNSDAASCLYDSPKPHLPIGPEVPPMTREEICKSAYGDNFEAVPLNSYRRSIIDICVYVICFEDKNPENLQYLMWVPERTPCDDEKICIKGLCTTN